MSYVVLTILYNIFVRPFLLNGVSPDKAELVLFSRRYKIHPLIPQKLKSSVLSSSDSAKYLGLVLDRKLNGKLNRQERCWKAIGIKWGKSQYIVLWLHTAKVRAILLYGILVWWAVLPKASITKQLKKIQRMAE